jgi:hypothetical protein
LFCFLKKNLFRSTIYTYPPSTHPPKKKQEQRTRE